MPRKTWGGGGGVSVDYLNLELLHHLSIVDSNNSINLVYLVK